MSRERADVLCTIDPYKCFYCTPGQQAKCIGNIKELHEKCKAGPACCSVCPFLGWCEESCPKLGSEFKDIVSSITSDIEGKEKLSIEAGLIVDRFVLVNKEDIAKVLFGKQTSKDIKRAHKKVLYELTYWWSLFSIHWANGFHPDVAKTKFEIAMRGNQYLRPWDRTGTSHNYNLGYPKVPANQKELFRLSK